MLGEETAKVGEILLTGEARECIIDNSSGKCLSMDHTQFEEVEVPRDDDEPPLIAYRLIAPSVK